jgi:hypothetical protein
MKATYPSIYAVDCHLYRVYDVLALGIHEGLLSGGCLVDVIDSGCFSDAKVGK